MICVAVEKQMKTGSRFFSWAKNPWKVDNFQQVGAIRCYIMCFEHIEVYLHMQCVLSKMMRFLV